MSAPLARLMQAKKGSSCLRTPLLIVSVMQDRSRRFLVGALIQITRRVEPAPAANFLYFIAVVPVFTRLSPLLILKASSKESSEQKEKQASSAVWTLIFSFGPDKVSRLYLTFYRCCISISIKIVSHFLSMLYLTFCRGCISISIKVVSQFLTIANFENV